MKFDTICLIMLMCVIIPAVFGGTCQPCRYSGIKYSHGATFTSGDGCYNCTCDHGCVQCTTKLCEPQPVYRAVTQSSVKDIREASRAVDGNFTTISHTDQPPVVSNPWWMLEFQCVQTISGVVVWNRQDNYANQLSNINITIDEQYCGSIGSDYPGLGENVTVTCRKPLTGTQLMLQKTETKALNLAEVQPIFVGPDGCNE